MEPERPDPPVVHEIHVSMVPEIGDRVYKPKKPVRLDFLDFRSRVNAEFEYPFGWNAARGLGLMLNRR